MEQNGQVRRNYENRIYDCQEDFGKETKREHEGFDKRRERI